MRFLPFSLLLLATGASAESVVPPHAHCARNDGVKQVATPRTEAPGFHRLDRLPPAAEYLAVYRRVDRCPAPVIVRFDIGTPRR